MPDKYKEHQKKTHLGFSSALIVHAYTNILGNLKNVISGLDSNFPKVLPVNITF